MFGIARHAYFQSRRFLAFDVVKLLSCYTIFQPFHLVRHFQVLQIQRPKHRIICGSALRNDCLICINALFSQQLSSRTLDGNSVFIYYIIEIVYTAHIFIHQI